MSHENEAAPSVQEELPPGTRAVVLFENPKNRALVDIASDKIICKTCMKSVGVNHCGIRHSDSVCIRIDVHGWVVHDLCPGTDEFKNWERRYEERGELEQMADRPLSYAARQVVRFNVLSRLALDKVEALEARCTALETALAKLAPVAVESAKEPTP